MTSFDKDYEEKKAHSDEWLPILFGSKTRIKLLKLFLANHNQAYYVREITRLTGAQINAIRRELQNLETVGIVYVDEKENKVRELKELQEGKVQQKGISGVEKKYFKINKDFIFFDELKKMFNKLRAMNKEDFVARIKEIGTIDYLALTGIFVGDNMAPVDVLIVGTIPDSKELQKIVAKLGEDFPREINYTHLTPEEFAYRKEIVDKFLYSILENKSNIVFIDSQE